MGTDDQKAVRHAPGDMTHDVVPVPLRIYFHLTAQRGQHRAFGSQAFGQPVPIPLGEL